MAQPVGRVTGIGGVFVRSSNPKRLTAWYQEFLGFDVSSYGGVNFLWSDEIPAGTGMTVWSAFAEDTKYFGPGKQQMMLNFRVDHLDMLLAKLREAGVEIIAHQEEYEYGRFAWIVDCDGNRVELWEPRQLSEDQKREFLT